MNWLSASRFYYKFTILLPKSLWINYLRPKINLNSLSATWISYGFTICFALNSPWIHYLCCRTTMNSLWSHYETTMKSLWIHYLLREFTLNPLLFSWYQYECTIFFTLSLGIHQPFRKFIICFANFLWIYYHLCDYSLNSFSFLLNSLSVLRIHSLLRNHSDEITMKSPWNHYRLRDFSLNSLPASRFHYEFTACFENSPWIRFFAESLWTNYLLRNFPLNSLSYTQNRYEFSIFFANLLSVSRLVHKKHYLLDDFNMNSPSFPQFNLEFTIYFVISFWIHDLFREFTMNSLIFSRVMWAMNL